MLHHEGAKLGVDAGHHSLLLSFFFAEALARAARATRRISRFFSSIFSRAFARVSDSFLALSRRRVKCTASAASILWIRASILALYAITCASSTCSIASARFGSTSHGPAMIHADPPRRAGSRHW